MKRVEILIVLLRGVNFGFWPHLGFSGENAIKCSPYVAMKVSFRAHMKKFKNVYLICF